MSRVLVEDDNSDSCAFVERDEVGDAIRPWFPGAPTEVSVVIDALQRKLNAHEYTGSEEAYLGVSVDLTGGS